jgi:hypothetical protein
MRLHHAARCALYIGAGALLASCGGSQPPIGAPSAMPQSRVVAMPARNGALLYIGDASSGGVLIYTYVPALKFVGILTTPSVPGGECVDRTQDVFITDETSGSHVTYEYAHGGTKPVAVLGDPAGTPNSCSVDPTTGNLAVTSHSLDTGKLAIYKKAKGKPLLYSDSHFSNMLFSGYDDEGNLFVDGLSTGPSPGFIMAELTKGGKALNKISLNQRILYPGGVQWDGKNVAVGDDRASMIYQFAISGSVGAKVGSTRLEGSPNIYQFFIYKGRVVDPTSTPSQGTVGIYRYPAGGRPNRSITGVSSPYSAVVSLAPH